MLHYVLAKGDDNEKFLRNKKKKRNKNIDDSALKFRTADKTDF